MDLTFFESQLYFITRLQGEHHIGEDSSFCDIEETRNQANEEPDITKNSDVRGLGKDINKCDPRDGRDLSHLNDKNS